MISQIWEHIYGDNQLLKKLKLCHLFAEMISRTIHLNKCKKGFTSTPLQETLRLWPNDWTRSNIANLTVKLLTHRFLDTFGTTNENFKKWCRHRTFKPHRAHCAHCWINTPCINFTEQIALTPGLTRHAFKPHRADCAHCWINTPCINLTELIALTPGLTRQA